MKMQFKGIKIGGLIISTKSQIEKSEFSFDSKEIWDLFKRVVGENKIVFTSTSHNTDYDSESNNSTPKGKDASHPSHNQ